MILFYSFLVMFALGIVAGVQVERYTERATRRKIRLVRVCGGCMPVSGHIMRFWYESRERRPVLVFTHAASKAESSELFEMLFPKGEPTQSVDPSEIERIPLAHVAGPMPDDGQHPQAMAVVKLVPMAPFQIKPLGDHNA